MDIYDIIEKYGFVAGLVLAGIGAIVAVLLFTGASSHAQALAEIESQRQAVLEEMDTVGVMEESVAAQTVQMQANQTSARKAGAAVAKCQNDYLALKATSTEEDIVAIRDEGRAMFSEDTVDAMVPWAAIDRGKGRASWEFATVYDFDAMNRSIPCVWLLRATDSANEGELLMWAEAAYNVETGLFGQPELHHSALYSHYISGTPEEEAPAEEEFGDLIVVDEAESSPAPGAEAVSSEAATSSEAAASSQTEGE